MKKQEITFKNQKIKEEEERKKIMKYLMQEECAFDMGKEIYYSDKDVYIKIIKKCS